MTSPGGGQNINLAALWVPVMPETSHLSGEKMREAGTQARRSFEDGFHGGGSGSPESMANSFADKFTRAFSSKMQNADMGLGVSRSIEMWTSQMERFGSVVDEKMANKIGKQLPDMYRNATQSVSQFTTAKERLSEVSDRESAAHQRVGAAQIELNAAYTRSAEVVRITNELHAQGITYQNALTEARQRMGTTENSLIESKQRVAQAERSVASATRQRVAAEEVVNQKQASANAALGSYNSALGEYSNATQHAYTTGSMFAGMMGGAMVLGIQGVIGGFEKIIELGFDVFKEAVHGAEELAEKLVEIGEEYHHLGIQVEEFSGASGAAFDTLTAHAEQVFTGLDVAGKNTGETMARLSTMLNLEPGSQQLDNLTRRVVELQGRYSNLKAADLGSIFHVFGIDADHVNESLATLLTTSRNAGQGLGDLVSAMSGDASATLREAGFSLGQVGHFVGELEKSGLPARSVMMGLGSAMKEYGKIGVDFKSGLRETINELESLGDTASGNKLASTMFGGRRWTEVMQMLPELKELIASTADAYDAPEEATDQFLEKTKTLENNIEEFKHHMEGVFEPLGIGAINVVEGGLDRVQKWFDENHHEIIGDIKHWGDEFIDLLPKIKDFAVTGLHLLEPMLIGLAAAVAPITFNLTAAAAAWLTITGHFSEAKDMLKINVDIPGMTAKAVTALDQAADKLGKMQIDTDKIKDGWDKAADSVDRMGDHISGLPGVANLPGMSYPTPFSISAGGSAPGAPGAPGTEPLWGGGTHAAAPSGPMPAPNAPLPASGLPAPRPASPGGLPQLPGTPQGTPGGTAGVPNLPGMPQSPIGQDSGYVAGGDRAGIAKAIYASIINAGYSPQTALYGVADSIYESGLDPSNPNNPTHFGLFQETGDKPHAGAAQQVAWFVNMLNSLGGPSVVDRDPKNLIANSVERGGYSGSQYDAKLAEAQSLLGATGLQSGGSPLDQNSDGPDADLLHSSMPRVWSGKHRDPGAAAGDPFSWSNGPQGLQSGGPSPTSMGGPGGHVHSMEDPDGTGIWVFKSDANGQVTSSFIPTLGRATGGPLKADGPNVHGTLGDPGEGFVHGVTPGSEEWGRMSLRSQNMATWMAMQLGMGGYQMGGSIRGFEPGGTPDIAPTDQPDPTKFKPWWPEKAEHGQGEHSGSLLHRYTEHLGEDMIEKFKKGNPFGDDYDPVDVEETKRKGLAHSGSQELKTNLGKQGLHQFFDMLLEGLETSGPELAESGVPGFQSGGRGPKDNIPAWLAPDEYVWNEHAVKKYGWFIDWANWDALHGNTGRGTNGLSRKSHVGARGFQPGGPGGDGAANYVASGAGNDRPDLVDPQLQYVMTIANGMGLTLTAGKSGHGTHDVDGGWHDSGQAGDYGNGRNTNEELAFAQYMFTHFGSELSELIYADPRMPKLIKDGKVVEPSFYGADTLAGHHDHVHVAVKSSQDLSDVMQPGSQPLVRGQQSWGGPGGGGGGGLAATPLDFNMPGGGGGTPFGYGGSAGAGGGMGPGGFPGLPGQHGGFGQYGGETYDQVIQNRRAVEHAQDRINELNKEIPKKQAERKRVSDELDKMLLDPPQIQQAEQDQINAKKQQLADLDDEISKIQNREIPEAQEDFGMAQRKQMEAQFKKPEGAGKKGAAGDAANDFGRNFLGGIAQSLGFPDIFGGKPPWEFGIFKMATRFLSPFLKEAAGGQDGAGSEMGYGGGGMPGMGGGGMPGMGTASNFMNGLGGDMGINLPKIISGGKFGQFQGGGPQVPFDANGNPTTPGPPPGPVNPNGGGAAPASYNIINDHSISVENHDPKLVGSLQAMQNSQQTSASVAATPGINQGH